MKMYVITNCLNIYQNVWDEENENFFFWNGGVCLVLIIIIFRFWLLMWWSLMVKHLLQKWNDLFTLHLQLRWWWWWWSMYHNFLLFSDLFFFVLIVSICFWHFSGNFRFMLFSTSFQFIHSFSHSLCFVDDLNDYEDWFIHSFIHYIGPTTQNSKRNIYEKKSSGTFRFRFSFVFVIFHNDDDDIYGVLIIIIIIKYVFLWQRMSDPKFFFELIQTKDDDNEWQCPSFLFLHFLFCFLSLIFHKDNTKKK